MHLRLDASQGGDNGGGGGGDGDGVVAVPGVTGIFPGPDDFVEKYTINPITNPNTQTPTPIIIFRLVGDEGKLSLAFIYYLLFIIKCKFNFNKYPESSYPLDQLSPVPEMASFELVWTYRVTGTVPTISVLDKFVFFKHDVGQCQSKVCRTDKT